MTYEGEPTIRLRRVGIELRRLREAAGLTVQQAGELLSRSPSSISKCENGQVRLYKRELDRILDRYGLEDEALRARLHTLNDKGRQKGWWMEYNDVADPAMLDYVSLEAEARAIRTYEPQLVPGLLQTEEYAKAVISSIPLERPEETVERFLALRMGRQRLLTSGSPPPVHAIVGEAALRQLVGGRDVMADQLELLAELAQADYLTLQVLPFAAGAHAGGDGPCIMLDLDAGHHVLVVNHALGSVYSDLASEVTRCMLNFDCLRSAALSDRESLAFIEQVAEDL